MNLKERTTFPTVGSGRFTINGPFDANSVVQVFDNSGRVRYNKSVNHITPQVGLELNHLPNGTYIVTYTSETKRITQKIIIQK